RVPRNLPFQIRSWRSKSRNPETACRSNPSRAAAARIARSAAAACGSSSHPNSDIGTTCVRARPVSSSGDRGVPGSLALAVWTAIGHDSKLPERGDVRSLQLSSRFVATLALGLALAGWVAVAVLHDAVPAPLLWTAGLLTLGGASAAALWF